MSFNLMQKQTSCACLISSPTPNIQHLTQPTIDISSNFVVWRSVANPAPLGLFAFGLTTALLQVCMSPTLSMQADTASATMRVKQVQFDRAHGSASAHIVVVSSMYKFHTAGDRALPPHGPSPPQTTSPGALRCFSAGSCSCWLGSGSCTATTCLQAWPSHPTAASGWAWASTAPSLRRALFALDSTAEPLSGAPQALSKQIAPKQLRMPSLSDNPNAWPQPISATSHMSAMLQSFRQPAMLPHAHVKVPDKALPDSRECLEGTWPGTLLLPAERPA